MEKIYEDEIVCECNPFEETECKCFEQEVIFEIDPEFEAMLNDE